MSGRHGYVDDLDYQALAMWRGRVASAIRGRRGQAMLRELRDALDAMPVKRLVSRQLQTTDGEYCTLGVLAHAKGADFSEYEDADEYDLEELNGELATLCNIAECMVQEIEYENDECGRHAESPEDRWHRMKRWVERHIKDKP